MYMFNLSLNRSFSLNPFFWDMLHYMTNFEWDEETNHFKEISLLKYLPFLQFLKAQPGLEKAPGSTVHIYIIKLKCLIVQSISQC